MNSKEIRITHFINPHSFWFEDTDFNADLEFLAFDEELQDFGDTVKEESYHQAKVGEVVAVFHFKWRKWIRACVDHVVDFNNVGTRYILWALDYGHPLFVDPQYIRKLAGNLAQVKINCINFGGICNIVPAKQIEDSKTLQLHTLQSNSWSSDVLDQIEDLFRHAASVKFRLKIQISTGQIFGELEIVTLKNENIKLDEWLIEKNEAKLDVDYLNTIKVIGTNRPVQGHAASNNGESALHHQMPVESVHENGKQDCENQQLDDSECVDESVRPETESIDITSKISQNFKCMEDNSSSSSNQFFESVSGQQSSKDQRPHNSEQSSKENSLKMTEISKNKRRALLKKSAERYPCLTTEQCCVQSSNESLGQQDKNQSEKLLDMSERTKMDNDNNQRLIPCGFDLKQLQNKKRSK